MTASDFAVKFMIWRVLRGEGLFKTLSDTVGAVQREVMRHCRGVQSSARSRRVRRLQEPRTHRQNRDVAHGHLAEYTGFAQDVPADPSSSDAIQLRPEESAAAA